MQKVSKKAENLLPKRSGVVVLELILTTPIFLMIMLAMVEISLIFTAIEQTAYASRYAAKIASETASGSLAGLVAGPDGPLKTNVDRVLRVGGLKDGSCRVILEHNVSGADFEEADPDPAVLGCECTAPTTALPSVSGISYLPSVRTTVCVPLAGNIPDFLGSLGFSIQDYVVKESTTYAYEF